MTGVHELLDAARNGGTWEDEVTLRNEGEIIKTDPSKQLVFGWAYVMQTKDG